MGIVDEKAFLSRFGVAPSAAYLPEIRRLISTLASDEDRISNEPLKTLCIQLFSAGEARDSLLIWHAKQSSFDAACYIDIQLVCGAGFRATRAYLLGRDDPEAKKLLEYLDGCEEAGDFDEFTPERHLAQYRRYYGIDG